MSNRGINRALIDRTLLEIERKYDNKFRLVYSIERLSAKVPCIFVSHQSADSEASRQVAEYIKEASIDVYLDDFDDDVAAIAEEGEAGRLTAHLTDAISKSTHMLCVVSRATAKSQWVPFELGFGHASEMPLSILTLKDMRNDTLPDYLRTAPVVRGIASLNEYLAKVRQTDIDRMRWTGQLKAHDMNDPFHPLDEYLQWDR